MLERHQEAPESISTKNELQDINWERVRDAPLVGLNGVIDWNQVERERILGLPDYSWTDENDNENVSENEPSEDYGDWVHEYDPEESYDVIDDIPDLIPDEVENVEYILMMVVD